MTRDLTTTAQGRFLDISRKEHLERARDGQVVSTRTAVTTLQKQMSPPYLQSADLATENIRCTEKFEFQINDMSYFSISIS